MLAVKCHSLVSSGRVGQIMLDDGLPFSTATNRNTWGVTFGVIVTDDGRIQEHGQQADYSTTIDRGVGVVDWMSPPYLLECVRIVIFLRTHHASPKDYLPQKCYFWHCLKPTPLLCPARSHCHSPKTPSLLRLSISASPNKWMISTVTLIPCSLNVSHIRSRSANLYLSCNRAFTIDKHFTTNLCLYHQPSKKPNLPPHPTITNRDPTNGQVMPFIIIIIMLLSTYIEHPILHKQGICQYFYRAKDAALCDKILTKGPFKATLQVSLF